MIRLILADDDPIVVQGLSMIVGMQDNMELLDTADNGMKAVTLCRTHRPDVVLLDIRMPEMDGMEAARIILNEGLSRPLFLSTFDETEFVAQALEMGVHGYILKNSPAQRILSSITTVAEGGMVFQQDILDYIRGMTSFSKQDASAFDGLTQREMEVVEWLSKGLSNAEIAKKMFISNGTVRNHVSVILEKTGLTHRTQIAVRYLGGK